ncbi:hypothetical protein FI667_g14002, partial [Globisporangium splendens]
MLPSRVDHVGVVDEDLGGPQYRSPQNKRISRRLMELEPLPVVPRIEHDWEADGARRNNKNVGSFVEDTRLETLTASSHSRRSAARWKDFASRNDQEELSHVRATDRPPESSSEDARHAVCIARESSSVVTQACWRRFAAVALHVSPQPQFNVAGGATSHVTELNVNEFVLWPEIIKEQKDWLKNPSKGYMLFTQRRYDHAALCLEYCFRQGVYTDGLDTTAQEKVAQDQWSGSASSLARGSRMPFSFSSAPTKLSPDWGPYFSSTVITEDTESIKYLKFCLMYALSLFEVYEATGTESSLAQSRAGWETLFQLCESHESESKILQHLRFQAQYYLVRCMFWSGKSDGKREALKETNKTGNEKSRAQSDDVGSRPDGGESTNTKSETTLKAEAHLKKCYQIIELWSSVGYYHGYLKSEQAKQILALAPVGAYLIHQAAESIAGDEGVTNNVEAQAQPLFSESSAQTMVLAVKLHDRISSLRIRVDENGLYYTKKIPTCRHFSLHQLVEGLPEAAGINVQHGVKKNYV